MATKTLEISHPGGQGSMFSKAGRYTKEKYIIFQKKDEILDNKSKRKVIGYMPNMDLKQKQAFDEEQIQDNFLKVQEKAKQGDVIKKKSEEQQPFYKITSRNKLEFIKSNKHPPPPCGYYHPKFSKIDKDHKQIWDFKRASINQSRRVQSAVPGNYQYEMTCEPPSKLKNKVYGNVYLNKQTQRGKFDDGRNNPHEGRFDNLYLSLTWSKMKKVPQYCISKTRGREDNLLYAKKEFAPSYNPNYEFGKSQTSLLIPQFDKLLSRKPFGKPSITKNEQYFNYDFYEKQFGNKSQLFKRVRTPSFQAQLNREIQNNEMAKTLPSFMQKHMSNRMTISHLNQKMLEQNNFQDSKFQTVTSGFNVQKKKLQKQDSFEEIQKETQHSIEDINQD